MKTYNKVDTIDSFYEIPWGKPVIVSGGIGRDAWMWRMPGVFEINNGKARFVNEFGMAKYLDEDTHISLNVLEAEG
jgi:hypothetical protein